MNRKSYDRDREASLANPHNNPRLRAALDHTWYEHASQRNTPTLYVWVVTLPPVYSFDAALSKFVDVSFAAHIVGLMVDLAGYGTCTITGHGMETRVWPKLKMRELNCLCPTSLSWAFSHRYVSEYIGM